MPIKVALEFRFTEGTNVEVEIDFSDWPEHEFEGQPEVSKAAKDITEQLALATKAYWVRVAHTLFAANPPVTVVLAQSMEQILADSINREISKMGTASIAEMVSERVNTAPSKGKKSRRYH